MLLLIPWLVVRAQGDSAFRTLVRSGDSAYAAGARSQAIAVYREAVGRDSTASSRTLYRLAVMLAEDAAFRDAIALHRLYMSVEPNDAEGALGLARTYSWAGRTDDALRVYRSVLAKEPDYRAAALGIGQVLAWAGRYPESVATYRAWLRGRPDDREAALTLGRTLAWWGGAHLREAERLYDSLRTVDKDMEARKGLALVAAWQGDLVRSERIWRELANETPNDAEIWTGLAQVLRWRGQPFEAREALHRALAISPTHRDARSQQRWLNAELSPVLHANVASTGDSDDNRAQIYIASASVLPWQNLAIRFEGVHVRAELLGVERTSQTGRTKATLRLPWGESDWRARLEIGVNRRPTVALDEPARQRSIGSLAISGQLSARAHGEVRFGRSVVDETVALIAGGIHITAAEADFGAQLGDRINVNAALSSGTVSSDSSSNSRLVTSLGARWLMSHGRSVGVALRTMQHAREARDGYFSPKRYGHFELTARARRGRDLGWVFSGDAGLGLQHIDYHGQRNTQPTQRLTGTVGYVWAPGLEWSLSAALANVATAMTSSASGYRFGSLTLGGRVPLR
ncbi:MAG: tetratricopeptide repeat protein [Gemmatimonadaceae bacterium]